MHQITVTARAHWMANRCRYGFITGFQRFNTPNKCLCFSPAAPEQPAKCFRLQGRRRPALPAIHQFKATAIVSRKTLSIQLRRMAAHRSRQNQWPRASLKATQKCGHHARLKNTPRARWPWKSPAAELHVSPVARYAPLNHFAGSTPYPHANGHFDDQCCQPSRRRKSAKAAAQPQHQPDFSIARICSARASSRLPQPAKKPATAW